jgi:cytochrome P450
MADLQFNPMDAEFIADPYPTYHRLRTEDPVHHSALGFWVLTRYEDVVAALRDPRLAKEAIASFVAARFGAPVPAMGLSMLDRDPPDHTRLRGLVSKAFTPRVVEGLRPRIQQIVDGLLDGVAARGSMDLIEEFAYPIPVAVICEMLGVPVEDHERFKGWSLDIARGLDLIWLGPDSEVGRRSVAARQSLAEYFRGLIAQRRAAPRADMLSGLIAAEEAGDKLNETELLATCILLLIAGHETTVNLIGNGALALLRAPDQLALLRRSPDLVGAAVDELLRFDGPVQITQRIATEDMEVVGCKVRGGDEILLVLGAANRDPAVFAEPHRLDVTRDARRHVGFGGGIHHCLGAVLARMETQIALAALLDRFGRIELAGAPVRRPTFTLRGLESLPVALN